MSLEGGLVLVKLVEHPDVRRSRLAVHHVGESPGFGRSDRCERIGYQAVEGFLMTVRNVEAHDQPVTTSVWLTHTARL